MSKELEAETVTEPMVESSTAVPAKNTARVWSGVSIAVLVIAVISGGVYAMTRNKDKSDPAAHEVNQVAKEVSPTSSTGYGATPTSQVGEKAQADQFSTDPVEAGKYLSLDACTGSGSKLLSTSPMKTEDLSIIVPYGLVAGGHVTPVDHQYFWGKDQKAKPNTYAFYAPSDGTIVDVQVRPKAGGTADYRVVISYSCTFFSYFDLANSLDASIASKMPAGWETKNGRQAVAIPVKEGQELGRIGGQSLDYAVWDTTKNLTGLLVPKAYANSEPWKIYTVQPTDYYTAALKAELLPYYVRTAEPRDGKLAYDVDAYAVGGWFKKGTNGYIGSFSQTTYDPQSYADGHLSIAPDLYDPASWVFSTGAINHGSQYGIKSPVPTPDKLNAASGLVKYELVQWQHVDEKGAIWLGGSIPKSITMSTAGASLGTVLVQMTGDREMKVETFLGKKPSQVSAFTGAALTYTRGDEATTMSAN